MNGQKIPSKWALRLAELHDLVMAIQDEFETLKSDLYCNCDGVDEFLEKEGLDYDAVVEEVEAICDELEDLEATTSHLDCDYNDYGYFDDFVRDGMN